MVLPVKLIALAFYKIRGGEKTMTRNYICFLGDQQVAILVTPEVTRVEVSSMQDDKRDSCHHRVNKNYFSLAQAKRILVPLMSEQDKKYFNKVSF